MGEHKVIVYSASWCPWCTKVKEFLAQNKVKFEERDVDAKSEYGQELQEKTKQTGIPVTFIDGKPVIGFNQPELKKLLGL